MKLNIATNTLKGLLIHLGMASAVLMLLSFTFFYQVLPHLTNKNRVVSVPDVSGMTLDKASKFLGDRDLNYEVTDSSYHSTLPPLTVLKQYPKASSKVKINRKISLTLNARTPPAVSFPDLTGSTFDFAQQQLKSLGLQIGTIQYRPDIAHNAILEARTNGKLLTAGQRVRKGSWIDLVIGNHNDQFPLPDFTGMPFDEAEAYLLGMNLKLKQTHFIEDESKEANTILKQLPLPDSTVRFGDDVELWVVKRGQE